MAKTLNWKFKKVFTNKKKSGVWREICVGREVQLQQCNFSVYFAAIDITANTPSGILSPLHAYMAQPLTTTVKVPATTATIFPYHKTNGTLCSNTSFGGGGGARRQPGA